MSYLIKHKDLIDLGCLFIDKDEEQIYLNKLNEEFAIRVGKIISSKLTEDEFAELLNLPPEAVCLYVEKNIPGSKKAVIKIRKDLLETVKTNRKEILLLGT